MLLLAANEKLLLVIRRHWYVLVWPAAIFIFLLILPSLLLVYGPSFWPAFATPQVQPLVKFSLAIYFMALLTFILVLWLNYYLDVWIITDQRIIDVEQHGLFHRTVSEITMERIQDITVEVPGLIATMLDFGTMRIQTAGELGEFIITEVPKCDRAKNIIVECQRKHMSAPKSTLFNGR